LNLQPDLREALSVGRPVARHACEEPLTPLPVTSPAATAASHARTPASVAALRA
jgi:hypothetical protein